MGMFLYYDLTTHSCKIKITKIVNWLASKMYKITLLKMKEIYQTNLINQGNNKGYIIPIENFLIPP